MQTGQQEYGGMRYNVKKKVPDRTSELHKFHEGPGALDRIPIRVDTLLHHHVYTCERGPADQRCDGSGVPSSDQRRSKVAHGESKKARSIA